MFGLLKKKISDFVGKLTKKEEEPPQKTQIKTDSKKDAEIEKTLETEKILDFEKPKEKKEHAKIEKRKKARLEKPEEVNIEKGKEDIKIEKEGKPEIKEQEAGIFDKLKNIVSKPKKEKPHGKEIDIHTEAEIKQTEPELKKNLEKTEWETKEKKERERKIKSGVFDQLKSVVTGKIVIKKEDISDLLDEFELGLLEGDVALEIASEIKESLEKRLIGKEISKGKLSEEINSEMREILLGIIGQQKEIDLIRFVKSGEMPVKIMFLGINGAGKTTTLAKIAHLFQKNGLKVVFAACDTFRAAAIEQLGVHGEKLGVKVIKRPYGSDSAAVAYDALAHAKAHGIDVVLIDTAGRQDNNIDLINELKKMDRVIKPDLKIYIGESIGGNAVIEQVSSFNKEIGLSGVILTKIDCDPKGGTIISISKTTGLPILYTTNGQGYDDIEIFDPKKIINNLLE
ncbi:MAG: signal recognition particle-docking protein FtsY [Candidatus Micrarchaeia archaeon]